jgi:transposase-like protein
MRMVVQGVSTRRVKKITTGLYGREFSRSTVSRLTEDLEKQVQAWAKRPLDQKYPFLVLGCPCTWRSGGKGRSGRRPCFWPLASARTASGRFWGFLVALSETGQAWERLIDQLKERGLSGVEVATSDAHEGLKQALRKAFPGLIWQRCQAHFKRNLMDQTPASYKDRMDQVLDQVLKASSQQEAQDRFDDLRGELAEEAPSALEVLEGGLHEATAVLALPDKYRKRLRTTKRDPAVHPGGPPPGKTDSDLSKRGVGSSACWGPLCRDP